MREATAGRRGAAGGPQAAVLFSSGEADGCSVASSSDFAVSNSLSLESLTAEMFSSTPVAPAYSRRTAAAGLPAAGPSGVALSAGYPENITSISAAAGAAAVAVNAPASASAFSSSSFSSSSPSSLVNDAADITPSAAARLANAAAVRPTGGGSSGGRSVGTSKNCSRPGHLLHKVKPADTLLSIALQYDVPVPHLMLANKLSSSDIWFVDTMVIPCTTTSSHTRGDATFSLTPVSSLSASLSPSATTAPATVHPQQQQKHTQSAPPPAAAARSAIDCTPEAPAPPAASGGTAAAAAQGQKAARNADSSRGLSAAEEKGCCVIPESVQQSARIAMLVEALVRQEGIDAKLARSQINHWNGDFRAAAFDCREIRRWQQALGVSVHEILAYLSTHDYDVDKAITAMVEDSRWHQAQILRQEEMSRAMPSRGWLFSLSSISQLFSPFSSATRYARLPHQAVEDERNSSSCYSPLAQSPRVIGRPSSLPPPAAATRRMSAAGRVAVHGFPSTIATSTASSLPLPSFFISSSSAVGAPNLSSEGRSTAAARLPNAQEKELTWENLRRRRRQQHTHTRSINVEMSWL